MGETNDNMGGTEPSGHADAAASQDVPVALARVLARVRAQWRSVWRLLRRLGVEVAELEGVTAQVFLAPAGEPDADLTDDVHPEQLRQSLCRTAVRIAGKLQSSMAADGRCGRGSLSSLPPPSLSLADSMVERQGLRQLLDRILDRMPFDARASFVLCDIEGCELSEAANLMDAPVADVSSRRTLGRELFRDGVARAGGAEPSARPNASQDDPEPLEWSPFERNVLRSTELDAAPNELQDGIAAAVALEWSAAQGAALDRQSEDRIADLFGHAPTPEDRDDLGGEDELGSTPLGRTPLRRRVAHPAAVALAAALALVGIALLVGRSCSSSPQSIAQGSGPSRARAPAMHSSPLGPRSTSDVGTQVAAEMRLQAPTDERAAPAGPKVAQRAGAREGVMSAPGDPSYEWWIGRFPLLDEDWKRMPGAEAASAGDALHSVNAGNEGLRDEGSRLDAVRMLLERSQATDALESLDAYRDRWPRGAMSADAMVLRVRALLELGRFDEAEQQAQVLESFAPNSQYARDARVLMATQKKARHP